MHQIQGTFVTEVSSPGRCCDCVYVCLLGGGDWGGGHWKLHHGLEEISFWTVYLILLLLLITKQTSDYWFGIPGNLMSGSQDNDYEYCDH